MMLTAKKANLAWRKTKTKFKTTGMTSCRTKWTVSLTTWVRKCLIHSDVVADLAVGAFADVDVVAAVVANASGCQADAARRTVACTVVCSGKTPRNCGNRPPPPILKE